MTDKLHEHTIQPKEEIPLNIIISREVNPSVDQPKELDGDSSERDDCNNAPIEHLQVEELLIESK